MEEKVDIFNKKGEKTGEVRTKKEAHLLGLLHRTVHVWILNSEKKLLIQKRSSTMEANPNYWDISASGHISAGQTSLEAAQRETGEEVGLVLPKENFKYLFTVEERTVLNNGTYLNNEFQDVYLITFNDSSPKITIEKNEVSETRWVSIAELKLWQEKGEPKFVPHDEEYKKLFEYLAKNS